MPPFFQQKPDNIGFDLRGDIKIFDFGLAKELPTIHNGHDKLFHFTGMCGSPRYMAPEVALEEPYNELCDVFSFSIVFWEMMTLSKPYGNIDMVGLIEQVWRESDGEDGEPAKALRPSPSLVEKGQFMSGGTGIKGMLRRRRERKRLRQQQHAGAKDGKDVLVGTPASLQALLEACWSYNLEKRPSMKKVVEKLSLEILAIRDNVNDERRLSHKRRRSTFIFEAESSNAMKSVLLDEAARNDAGDHGNDDRNHPLDISKSTSQTDPSSTVRTEGRSINL